MLKLLRSTIYLFVFLLAFIIAGEVSAATEFVSIIDPDNASGTDYTTLSAWEDAIQADLTSTGTLVFDYSIASGTIPDGYTVLGETSGAIASSTHVSTTTEGSQIMLTNIVGTFQSGETVYIQGLATSSYYVILADAGDSVIAVAECRSTGGGYDDSMVDVNGWTTSSTTYVKIWTDPDDIYGRHDGTVDGSGYTMKSTNGDEQTRNIAIHESYTVVDGIKCIRTSSNWLYGNCIFNFAASVGDSIDITIKNNLLIQESGGDYGSLIGGSNYWTAGYGKKVYNNILISFSEDLEFGIEEYDGYPNDFDHQNFFHNNTIYGTYKLGAFYYNVADATGETYVASIKNNYFANTYSDTSIPDIVWPGQYGTTTANFAYNATDDESAGTANNNQQISVADAKFAFTADDLYVDLHLKSDSSLIDQGTSTLGSIASLQNDIKYDIDGTARGGAFDLGADEVPVQFISTICENTSAGGDCSETDYNSLYDWEDAVEVDLVASTTRVFSGGLTAGQLNENDAVILCDGINDTGIDGVVVATTSDQILIDGITGTTSPLVVEDGFFWSIGGCAPPSDYWTISGSGDDLGASPMAVAKIDGNWNASTTQPFGISGWGTDSDNNIKVYTTDLARHNGKWNENRFRIFHRADNDWETVISIYVNYVWLDGLQVEFDDGGFTVAVAAINIGGVSAVGIDNKAIISNSIIRSTGSTSGSGNGIAASGGGVSYSRDAYLYNNIVYGFNSTGINIQNQRYRYYYNNTVYVNGGNGINASGALTKNNLSFDNGASDFWGGLWSNASSTNNISGDATANDNNLNNGIINQDASSTFVDLANRDFHIVENSVAQNAGVDLSNDPYVSFLVDIDGSARNVDEAGWDIGADEIATKIYRSVGNDSSDLSNTATVTISGNTATFSVAQPDNVGVGDVIQYGNSGSYNLAFITSRASSTEYSVQAYSGGIPTATTTASMNIYRAYLELNDWETNTEASVNSGIDSTVDELVPVGFDLVASGTIMMVPCYASSDIDDAFTNINDWETGIGNYIKIYTPTDTNEVGVTQRHKGKWDTTNGYMINTYDNSANSIRVGEANVRIEGLQLHGYVYSIYLAPDEEIGDYYVSDNIIKGSDNYGLSQSAFSTASAYNGATLRMWNNILFDSTQNYGLIYIAYQSSFWDAYIYNNTLYNTVVGIRVRGGDNKVYAYNNIIQECSSLCFLATEGTAEFVSGSDNNICNLDETLGGNNDKANAVVKFVDAENYNFHLDPYDTVAVDVGTSTPVIASFGDTIYDIDGNYRRSWDIGADEASIEYVASVMEDGTGDFTRLYDWEDAIESDLLATTTAVFTATTSVGQFQSYELSTRLFTGQNSGATGRLIHIATSTSDVKQILLVNIDGDFEVGEEISDGYGTTTLENLGNPVIATAKIDGAWTSAEENNIVIDGWETGAHNYIRIYTTDTARHNGKWNDQKYRLVRTGTTWTESVVINEDYLVFDGIQISLDRANSNIGIVLNEASSRYDSERIIKNNIIKNCNNSISNYGDNQKSLVINNIMYSSLSNSVAQGGWRMNSEFYYINNTIINSSSNGFGFTYAGKNVYINNIVLGSADSDYLYPGTVNIAYNNITSDNTAPGTNAITNATVQFVDETNYDFHLSQNDTVARDAGINLFSTSTFAFTGDIDGTNRGASWDIGADELPVQFVSTICEDTSAGGACNTDMDYSTLSDWEDAVEVDLTATSTRVFGGSGTGRLIENDVIYLFDTANTSVARGTVVATTSDQILIDNIVASSTLPLYATTTGYVWRLDALNYWTVAGSGDDLGASAMAVAKIDGTWDNADIAQINLTGWETDYDNGIRIYTTDTARHGGKWNNNKYRLTYPVTNSSAVFNIYEDVVAIDGIQVENSGDNTSTDGIRIADTDIYSTVSNCIIKKSGYGSSRCGIIVYSAGESHVYNNIIYGFEDVGVRLNDVNLNSYVYNNTVYNIYGEYGYGIYAEGGDIIAVNNIVASTTDPFRGTFASGTQFNASFNTDTPNGGTASIINASFDFISTASGTEDFHIGENSDVINVGFDLIASTSLFTTDIDGSPRNVDGLGWDIGADEVASKIYRSVGNDSSDLSNTATVTISGTIATFSDAQPDNVGVGDVIQYGNSGSYKLAFITSRASSTEYSVQAYDGSGPTATTSASMEIFRAYLELDDWNTNSASAVNSGIDSTVEGLVVVNKDLVASGTIMMVPCYASDNGDIGANVHDWTTGAQNYIKIYTPVDSNEVGIRQRHQGVWDDNYYYLNATDDHGIYSSTLYLRIEGLQISVNSSSDYGIDGMWVEDGEGEYYISDNIIKAVTGEEDFGIYLGDSDINIAYIWNNIIYGGWGKGMWISAPNIKYVYNNTIVGCEVYGMQASNDDYEFVYNNIVVDTESRNDWFLVSDANASNNISNGEAPLGIDGLQTKPIFVDENNDNYHLSPSDTVAVDNATSTIGSIPAYSDMLRDIYYDIDGNYRRSWDIGADEASIEYVSSVMEGGVGDFSSLSAWEDAIESNIVATNTVVFTATTSVGQFQPTRTFVGQNNGATGELIHISTTSSDIEQILLVNVSGDFEVGEVISDGYGTTTLENLGNPVIATAKIDGVWTDNDITGFTIDGWETGANNYVKIYTTDIARHRGKWGETNYRLYRTDNICSYLTIRENYVKIDGLAVKDSCNNEWGRVYFINMVNGDGDITISNSIGWMDYIGNSAGVFDVYEIVGDVKIRFMNNISIAYGGITEPFRLNSGNITAYLYNNTGYVIAGRTAFYKSPGAEVYAMNNIGYAPTSDAFSGSFHSSSDYNISNDGTAPGSNSITNTTVQFADETNYDFHLSQNDTVARDAGVNLFSTSTLAFTTDVDGTSRGASWDIGADELPVQFVSTICENTSAGGVCSEMDYNSLAVWEDAVEVDLTATSTRVFGGSMTAGIFDLGDTVYLLDTTGTSTARGTVVATTSDQILVNNIIASSTLPVTSSVNYIWQLDGSNYWTVSGSGDDLGASAMAVAKIDGTWSNAENVGVTIDDWNTDNDNLIKIYTTDTARHGGKWDDDKYRIVVVDDYGFSVFENYVDIDGVQISIDIESTGAVNYKGIYYNVSGDNYLNISNNIIKMVKTNSSGYNHAVHIETDCYSNIYNNIIYGFYGINNPDRKGGVFVEGYSYFYNNTFYNNYTGINNALNSNSIAVNNIMASTTDPFTGSQDFLSGTQYNATDGTDTPNGGTNTIINANFDFISTASGTEDLHIGKESGALNVGFDLTASTSLFVTDIDGSERNIDGLGWDIGADEVATKIYRSVGNDSSDLSNTATVTISGTTATFSAAQPDNVGVGDVIQYGESGNYQLAFITARASSTEYSVQAYDGGIPSATTTASMEIFRAYLELNDWETNTESSVNSGIDALVDQLVSVDTDLVASGTIMMVPCYNADIADDAYTLIQDWNTSDKNYIKIYTPVDSSEVGVSQRHNGKWDDDKFSIESDNCMTIFETNYVYIDGLQISLTVGGNWDYGIILNNSEYIYISNNIVKDAIQSGTNRYGITQASTGDYLYLWNNVVYGFTTENSQALSINPTSAPGAWVYNNTVVNSNECILVGWDDTITVNNITQGCQLGFNIDILYSGSGYNISEDGTATGINSQANVMVKFVDEANDDFHLSPTDTTAIDAGTSTLLSFPASVAREGNLEYDIDGNYRRTWDIGADEASIEYVASVMEGGVGDFTTLSAWEDGIESDLVSTTTAVFTATTSVGQFQAYEISTRVFTGQISGATGRLIHIATTTSDIEQILLVGINGDFEVGEVVSDGYGTTTLQNLGNPVIAVAKIDGTWSSYDTAVFYIDGWETGARNFVKVYATDTAKHKGRAGNYNYRMYGNGGYFLRIYEDYTDFSGIELNNQNSFGIQIFAVGVKVHDNIVYGISGYNVRGISTYAQAGLYINGGSNYIYNNIVYNGTPSGYGGGIYIVSYNSTTYVYNNTVYNINYNGISRDAELGNTVIAINNIVASTTNPFYGTFAAGTQYNATDHVSDTPTGGTNTINNASFDFVSTISGAEDFHLGENSDAINSGVNLFSTSTLAFTTDVDGTSRGASWDIGADELPVQFVSTICENISAGGACSEMDYNSLAVWEDAVEVDLTATSTRVFSGSMTAGIFDLGDTVYLLDTTGTSTARGTVVATTSDQILVNNIIASSTLPVTSSVNYIWQLDGSNYWTVSGSGDDLGASAMAVAKIDGTWSNEEVDAVTINNWITDYDNNIRVYTTELARHNGSWDNTAYRIMPSIDISSTIQVNESYTWIDGLQLQSTTHASDYKYGLYVYTTGVTGVKVSNNIIKNGNKDEANRTGILLNTITTAPHYVWNNIVYDFINGKCISANTEDVPDSIYSYIFNNTVYNCETGIYVSYRDGLVINNIVSSSTDSYYGTYVNGSSYNATDDTDTPSGVDNHITNASFDFVSTVSGSEDLHIGDDSEALNTGFDLTATTSLFVIDIDGAIRNVDGLGWDIGADEIASKIYRSVGNDSSDLSNSATVTISGTTATFSAEQPKNVGVGDVIQYGNSGSYKLAFITARASSTEYTVQSSIGTTPSATTTADMAIYRAHLLLDDWEDQVEADVNDSIDDLVSDLVLVNTDLVASGTIMMVPCYSSDNKDNEEITIDSWNTGSKNYIKIYTPVTSGEVGESQRHNGKWDDDKFNIVTNSSDDVIHLVTPHVRLEGLQLQNNRTSGTTYAINAWRDVNYELYLSSSIIRGPDNSTSDDMTGIFTLAGASGEFYIWNNIFYNWINDSKTAGSCSNLASDNELPVNYYNNTLSDCYNGISGSGSLYLRLKNNIINNIENHPVTVSNIVNSANYNVTDKSYLYYYWGFIQSDHDNDISSANVQFVDEANDDFHLAPSDTVAIDAGTSTVLDSIASLQNDIVYDIDGNYRRSWDIGADEASIEYVASVMEGGVGDFSTLSAWEDGIESAIVATTTAVFTATTSIGQFQSYEVSTRLFIGQTSGATGQLIHISTTSSDVEQILLVGISGDFEAGEELSDGYGTTTIQNLGNPVIAVAKIDGFWSGVDSNVITIDGWTTGKANYIKVYTTDTARHNGKWSDDKYRISVSTSLSRAIIVYSANVIIDGVQINNNWTGGYDGSTLFGNKDNITFKNNLLKKTGGSYGSGIEYSNSTSGNDYYAYIYNNIIYDFPNMGIYAATVGDAKVYVYNNTVDDCGMGIRGHWTYNTVAYNNIVQGVTSGYGYTAGFDSSSDYNISSDGTVPGANSLATATVRFVDETNYDLHLSQDDTVARDAGINLFSTTTLAFTDDVDGTSRGNAWDIGADELPVKFVSTICQAISTGGDCSEMDYSSLANWETAVESDLTATSTRVFSGSMTAGIFDLGDTVYLLDTTGTSTARGTVVATTSDQILLNNIIASSTLPLIASANYVWQLDSSNYWTVTGSGDDLGASPVAVAKIDGEWSSADSYVSVNGWTTDYDNNIKIYTTDTARHNGKWDDTKYRIVRTMDSGYQGGVMLYANDVDLSGIQVGVHVGNYTEPEGIQIHSFPTEVVHHRIYDNIIRQISGEASVSQGIGGDSNWTPYGTIYIYNNIVYNFTGYSIIPYSRGDIYVYNNTIHNSLYGIRRVAVAGNNTIIINNIVSSTTIPFTGTFSSNSQYNATDGTETPTGGSNTITNTSFDFISTASGTEDFHIGENSDVINAGFDLTASISLFTSDIDGAIRDTDGLGWDIGADEVATKIYRSVGNISSAVGSGGNTLSVSSTTRIATFLVAQPDNVGVGDAIIYGGQTEIAFITGRIDSTSYYVQNYDGSAPVATSSVAVSVYRSFLELSDWEGNTTSDVNQNIPVDLRSRVTVNSDLTASNTILMVPCYASDDGDNSSVVISGWTTNAGNYIKIYTPVTSDEVGISQRHSGKWDDDKYHITNIAWSESNIYISENYVRIEGLQIDRKRNGNGTGGIYIGLLTTAGDIYLFSNLIKSTDYSTGYSSGIHSYNSSGGAINVYIYNNIIYEDTYPFSGGMTLRTNGYSFYVYNNTVFSESQWGNYYIDNSPTVILKNNLSQSLSGTAQGYGGGAFDSSSDYNISDLASDAPNATFTGDQANVEFVDETNFDFHLSPSDTKAVDLGTSTVVDFFAPLQNDIYYDVDGNYRRSWDIGADEASIEYVASVMEGGVGDFSSLSAWEDGIESDLVATTTAVFTATTSVGQFQAYEISTRVFTGQNTGATGQLIHIATSTSDVEQILLVNIDGDFEVGEVISDGYGTTTLENLGNPVIAVAKIDGVWSSMDSTSVNISGWTVGEHNYIRIFANGLARQNGIAGSGYVLGGMSNDAFVILEYYVVVDGFEIANWTGDNNSGLSPYVGARYLTIKNMLVHDGPSGSTCITVYGQYSKVYNNITYGCDTGIYAGTSGSYSYIYNNTSYGNRNNGIYNYAYVTSLKNNLSYNNEIDFSGNYNSNEENNVSSDDTAPAYGSYYRNANVQFIDEENNDFHLSELDNVAKDSGVNLSTSTDFSFRFDIDGQSRYDVAWDIGADEAPTILYRSVGNDTNEISSSSSLVTISGTTATFNQDQPANMGVGDVLQYGNSGSYQLAFITGRTSSTTYSVQARDGTLPIATTTASVVVYRAHEYLSDWEGQIVDEVNNGIDASVDDLVLMPNMDLTASNTAMFVPCYASSTPDNKNRVYLAGWDTSTTSYIKIYTPTVADEVGVSQRHNGVWDDSKYVLEFTASSNVNLIHLTEDYVRIEGLQVSAIQNGYVLSGIGFNYSEGKQIYIEKNIFKSDIASGTGIFSGSVTAHSYILNNIVYGFSTCVGYANNTPIRKIYNNTISNCNTGLYDDGGNYNDVQNNVLFNNENDFYGSVGSFEVFSYNASDDLDGDNAIDISSGLVEAEDWARAFTDYINGDFSIKNTNSVLYDTGTSITIIDDDILGITRPYHDEYDLGAFEFDNSRPSFKIQPGLGGMKMQGYIKFK